MTFYSRLLILCFRDETTDPDGGLPSSLTSTKYCSPRQQPGPSGGSLCFLKGFLSHLLTLSLLRHNLLPLLYDVMLDHSDVISACNTTISALYGRCNKAMSL